jgi:hypothetical protein
LLLRFLWFYPQWEGLEVVRASPTLARQWLMQMGYGSSKQNVTVQYCMSLTRMVMQVRPCSIYRPSSCMLGAHLVRLTQRLSRMQSIEIPAVTTFRASDDYGPGQTGYYPTQKNASIPPTDGSKGCTFPYCVYYQGTSAIIAHALDLKPSKDNYWSTALQPGSAFNRHGPHPTFLNDTHEPYNEMQSAISSYTTAQVAPSDGIGFSNASLIKMACRSDGKLLQPSAPARAIDASFALSGAPKNKVHNVHAVMATHSLLAHGMKWAHVLTIGLSAPFSLTNKHLGDDGVTGPALAWTGYQPSDTVGKRPANITLLGSFSDTAPLVLSPANYSNFGLYHIAPIHPLSKMAFLGEVGKWVPIASDRVTSVTDGSDGLTVAIIGVASEVVELAFADSGAKAASSVVCTLGSSGKATAKFDGKKATCA